MTDVTILHEAEVELWEAVEYYEENSPGLGFDFETEIERSLETIAEHPERWPLRADGTRRYLAHRFPLPRDLRIRAGARLGSRRCTLQTTPSLLAK